MTQVRATEGPVLKVGQGEMVTALRDRTYWWLLNTSFYLYEYLCPLECDVVWIDRSVTTFQMMLIPALSMQIMVVAGSAETSDLFGRQYGITSQTQTVCRVIYCFYSLQAVFYDWEITKSDCQEGIVE